MTQQREALKQSLLASMMDVLESQAMEHGCQYSRHFIDSLVEITYKQIELLGKDVALFARQVDSLQVTSRHAKRSTVQAEDVKLLARRNPSLLNMLNQHVPEKETRSKKDAA